MIDIHKILRIRADTVAEYLFHIKMKKYITYVQDEGELFILYGKTTINNHHLNDIFMLSFLSFCLSDAPESITGSHVPGIYTED
jgi:hypothetical protein